MRPVSTPARPSASRLRRLAVVLTLVVTVLAGWFAPATSAEAKAPKASQLSPASVQTSGGTRVTITGRNLSKVKAVYVGATKVKKVTHVSGSKLRFTAPRHGVGTAKIKLLVGKRKYSTSLKLVYTAPTGQPDTYESTVLALTNAARSTARTCGNKSMSAVPPLTWNPVLGGTAEAHSADMAAHNFFSHDSSDGTAFDVRITQAGYRWNYVGENIAAGRPTPQSVMDAWLKSAGHCENIMSPDVTELGVGYVAGGKYGTYWTQDFGHPAG